MNQIKINEVAKLMLSALDQWEHVLVTKTHMAKPSVSEMAFKKADEPFDCVICGEKIKNTSEWVMSRLMSLSMTMTPQERYEAVDRFFKSLERKQ